MVAYQKSRKLTATGIVTSPVWRALSATPPSRPQARTEAGAQARTEAGAQARTEAGTDGDGQVRGVRQGRAQGRLQGLRGQGAAVGAEDRAGRRDFGPQTKAKVVAYQKARS